MPAEATCGASCWNNRGRGSTPGPQPRPHCTVWQVHVTLFTAFGARARVPRRTWSSHPVLQRRHGAATDQPAAETVHAQQHPSHPPGAVASP